MGRFFERNVAAVAVLQFSNSLANGRKYQKNISIFIYIYINIDLNFDPSQLVWELQHRNNRNRECRAKRMSSESRAKLA